MTSDSTTRQPRGRTAILCHLPNLRGPAWAACPVPSSSLGAPQDPQVGQEGAQADTAPPEGTAHSLLLSLMTSAFSGSARGRRENRTRGADFGDISTAIPGAGTQNHPLKRKICSPGGIPVDFAHKGSFATFLWVSGWCLDQPPSGQQNPVYSQSRSSLSTALKTKLLNTHHQAHEFLSTLLALPRSCSGTVLETSSPQARRGMHPCTLITKG